MRHLEGDIFADKVFDGFNVIRQHGEAFLAVMQIAEVRRQVRSSRSLFDRIGNFAG